MTPEQAKNNFKPTLKYNFRPAGVPKGSPNWHKMAKEDLDAKFDSSADVQGLIDGYQAAGLIEGAVNKTPDQPPLVEAPADVVSVANGTTNAQTEAQVQQAAPVAVMDNSMVDNKVKTEPQAIPEATEPMPAAEAQPVVAKTVQTNVQPTFNPQAPTTNPSTRVTTAQPNSGYGESQY